MNVRRYGWLIVALGLVGGQALAQQKFADLVGPVKVQPVKETAQLEMPFITWGGDVATFLANGGLTTQKGTIFGGQGLNLKLGNGDDFVQQVRDYMAGKTPFLRGTFRMLGQASEVVGSDPRTKPVVFLQLSWSMGDHIVARGNLKTLNDLAPKAGKKVKIACQQGGPHVGLLDDVLRIMAEIDWEDVEVVWLPDLTGDKGPAELFRKDPSIDACCVITPDMIGLTGGRREVGSGAEGTVKGAHVLASTDTLLHSIADVYACRSDWFKANRPLVEKFVVGYLKATAEVVGMRDDFEKTHRMSSKYKALLEQSKEIFPKGIIETIEIDGHGLLLDCDFAGVFGNYTFFKDKGFQYGFDAKMSAALEMAAHLGIIEKKSGFDPVDFDYENLAKLAGIDFKRPPAPEFVDLTDDPFSQVFEKGTLVTFSIPFAPNQVDFPVSEYRDEFNGAVKRASLAPTAVIVIRGHSDPTQTLLDLVRAGMAKGIVRRAGDAFVLKTPAGNKSLDLTQTETIVKMVEGGEFEGTKPSPTATMQAALTLSDQRAENVQQGIMTYAKQQGISINAEQIQAMGVGIMEPVVSKPVSAEDRALNRRVEVKVVEVPGELDTDADVKY